MLGQTFLHGVFFVALAAVTDADVMWKKLADSLDVSAEGRSADAVTGYLAGRRALLVLDNLEQLAGAGAVVAALLAAAPGLVYWADRAACCMCRVSVSSRCLRWRCPARGVCERLRYGRLAGSSW